MTACSYHTTRRPRHGRVRVLRAPVWPALLLAIGSAAMSPALAKGTCAELERVKHPTGTPKPPWRALADYPRPPAPDTGWGIHDETTCMWVPPDPDAFFKELKSRWGFSWYKVLACGANKMEVVKAARQQGVEPVVRIYAPGPHPHFPRPGDEEAGYRKLVREYVAAGAHYFEAGNEPNLGGEWGGHYDETKQLELMCEQWLRVKRMTIEEGGIPVFYAMTPGSAGEWWQQSFDYFKQHGQIEDAFAGAAFGAHLGTINHPLDYPFNPEKNMPHATCDEWYQSLLKDNTNYRACELIMLMMGRYLPHPIPILSTEGGVWVHNRDDRNYPEVSWNMQTQWIMEMFNRFNPKDPNYWGDPMFAQMCWEYNGWFNNWDRGKMQGVLAAKIPALDAMEKAEKFDRGIAFQDDGKAH